MTLVGDLTRMARGTEGANLLTPTCTPETQPEGGQASVVTLPETRPCCPNTRAQAPTLVSSQCGCSHCTQRATELPRYVPRCPDHQKEVGATRPYQTLAQSHSQTGRLKQTAPVPAPRCSSCPAGASLEQPLLQTAAWGCGEPLPAPAPGTGKLRSMCH